MITDFELQKIFPNYPVSLSRDLLNAINFMEEEQRNEWLECCKTNEWAEYLEKYKITERIHHKKADELELNNLLEVKNFENEEEQDEYIKIMSEKERAQNEENQINEEVNEI